MDTDRFRVEPGTQVRLADIDPRSTPGFPGDKVAGRARTAAPAVEGDRGGTSAASPTTRGDDGRGASLAAL